MAEELKVLTSSNQNGKQQGDSVDNYGSADKMLPVHRWSLTFHIESVRNVVNPHSPFKQGNSSAKRSDGCVGKGKVKKANASL
jgi:hypothetical protein